MLQQEKQMKENKGVISRNCAPFIYCKSKANNAEIDKY